MRSWIYLLFLLIAGLAAVVPSFGDEPPFRPLFDGKTFNGWEGNLKVFRIEDGAIVGGNLKKGLPENEFLCTTKEYPNFELTMQFKILGKGANAGVQIRTKRVPNSTEVIGYQADLAEGLWGCLWEEGGRYWLAGPKKSEIGKPVKRQDWNDYRIRCQGNHVEIWINNVKTTDYYEKSDKALSTGVIGLQIHSGPPSEAWYRNVMIKELPES